MPILAAETSVFPHNLLGDFAAQCCNRRWWALHTKSRQEKSLARQLSAMEVPFYLPLVKKFSNIGGRKVRSLLPLFSGYLFLFGTDEERVQSLATHRVTAVLPAPDAAAITQDLQNIRRLIDSGVPLTEEARLQPGFEMTECDVVKRAGIAERAEIGTSERGERTARLTYINGQRPGIYYFTAGRLTTMERAPEPAAPQRPAKKPAKRAAQQSGISVQ